MPLGRDQVVGVVGVVGLVEEETAGLAEVVEMATINLLAEEVVGTLILVAGLAPPAVAAGILSWLDLSILLGGLVAAQARLARQRPNRQARLGCWIFRVVAGSS